MPSGAGYVAPIAGDYAKAVLKGVDVRCMLVETFGALSPEFVDLLRECGEMRANRLNHSEYDQTTWAARTWSAFSAQKLSVAVHLAMATEVAVALGLPVAGDPRAA